MLRYLIFFIAVPMAFGQTPNTLSPEETMAGYDLLFNGQNLNNWHAYRQSSVTNAWTVQSGGLLGQRIEIGSGTRASILSQNTYQNFDLKIDWQSPSNGNSGIFVRYLENAASEGNQRTGPEAQIAGPQNSDGVSERHTAGACYDMFAVPPSLRNIWTNPNGTWNQFRIVAFDSNYVHYGNGVKLLEYKIGTSEFIAAYNLSKYVSDGNNGMYYDLHAGSVLLQHHGETGITFRNIKIKDLSDHPFTQEFPTGQWPDNLPQDYVFGKRGCTSPTASNYDPTAEVDDGTCAVPVQGRFETSLNVDIKKRGGELFIRVPSRYSAARLHSVKGAEVELLKGDDSSDYIVKPGKARPGLHILSADVNGQRVTRLLMIQ